MWTARGVAFVVTGLAAFEMDTGSISGAASRTQRTACYLAQRLWPSNWEPDRGSRAASNSSGDLLARLPVGLYSLTVRATNFKQSALPRLEVHVTDRLRQNFTLQVGDSRGLVTVIADPESVQLGSAEVRDVMERLQVSELPLKGRQFLDLAMLTPASSVRPAGPAATRCSRPEPGQCAGAAQRTQPVFAGRRRDNG